MARPTSPTLTDAELRLMDVLWTRGPSTATEIVSTLGARARVSDSTVRTILRILEGKGYVRHRKEGRAFRYHAAVERGRVRQNVVRYLLERFFNHSPELLVLNVLEHERLDEHELARLKAMLAESEPRDQ